MMKNLFVPATVILSSIAAAAQTPPAPPEPPPPPDNVFFYQPLEKAEVLHRGAKPVANAPYQGTMMNETVQHLADGNTIQNSHTSKVARDSQGRTWREETLDRVGPWSTSSGPTTVVFITDPVAGYSYVLHPDERTASRRPMPKIVATPGQQVPSSRPGPALPPPPPPPRMPEPPMLKSTLSPARLERWRQSGQVVRWKSKLSVTASPAMRNRNRWERRK